MLTADLHTHTLYSHGKGSAEQNVLFALARGLKRIAISEHGPKHLFFPVKLEKLKQLRTEIDLLQDQYGDRIQIEMGLEANLLGNGITDVPEDVSIFDFILVGFHKGVMPRDTISKKWFLSFFHRQSKRHSRENAEAYMRMMDRTPKLLAITHPGTYIPVDIPLLARESAARGVALEINEAHKNLSGEELRAALEAGGQFLISSDAHRPERVGICEYSIALARRENALSACINYESA